MPAIAIPAAAKAALETDFMVTSVHLQWTNLETDPSITLDLQIKRERGVRCVIRHEKQYDQRGITRIRTVILP